MVAIGGGLLAGLLVASCSTSNGSSTGEPSRPAVTVAPDDAFPVGSTGTYILWAHCGVQFAVIDGTTWRTRARDDGQGNPPSGWPDAIEGTLNRPSERRVIFKSPSIPEVLVFKPSSRQMPGCA